MDDNGTPEMVMRVAEALRTACRDEFGTDWNYGVSWKFARAAIRAMREPTEGMLKPFFGDKYIDRDPEFYWDMMIDLALKG